jgi:hypothetical protein
LPGAEVAFARPSSATDYRERDVKLWQYFRWLALQAIARIWPRR